MSAYGCEDRIRQARIVLIEGGSALQVLNFCIFPDPSYALPSFAADLVTLPWRALDRPGLRTAW